MKAVTITSGAEYSKEYSEELAISWNAQGARVVISAPKKKTPDAGERTLAKRIPAAARKINASSVGAQSMKNVSRRTSLKKNQSATTRLASTPIASFVTSTRSPGFSAGSVGPSQPNQMTSFGCSVR